MFVAIFGLRDLIRGASLLFIWPELPRTIASYFELAAGALMLALAVALWKGRWIRPLLVPCLPIVIVGTALSYHAALVERSIDPSSRQALPMWVFFGVAVLAFTAVARWIWRQAATAAP